MPLEADFLSRMVYLSPKNVYEMISSEDRPSGASYWTIKNEVCPADLFCYLYARFGPPNGIQNFFRADHSDNLVHWNWTFACDSGLVDIQGTNFRTYVWFIGDFNVEDVDAVEFASLIKADFKNYGKQMSECRQSLESWIEFVNPYQRLRRAVDQLVEELGKLKIDEIEELPEMLSSTDQLTQQEICKQWKDTGTRLHKAFGICFGIRAMLPVMAEAFVNLILYILMRPELKRDARLRENAFKQHVDVRVKSLHLNCKGFKQPVDYSNSVCGRYHSLVNERNDLLHGNVAIEKLRFNDVYFAGNVPVFKEYRSMWNRAFEIQRESVGLDQVLDELSIVTDFIEYVLSCLDDRLRPNVEQVISRLELGLHKMDDRVGVLFAEHLVDFRPGPPAGSG